MKMVKLQKTHSAADTLQKKLDEGHEIRPFPQSVGRLLSAIKDPNASSADFANIIESDAALSSKLLRFANCPIYSVTREVRSSEHAVTMLGTRPLRNMALAFAGSSMISQSGNSSKQLEGLWNHSLACATVARLLAKTMPSVSSDDAFLAGIFHDIGKLFFFDVAPKDYPQLVASKSGIDLARAESDMFGVAHDEVGLKLMVAWPLPEEIKVAVRYHHQPDQDFAQSELTAVIHLADALARAFGIGSDLDSSIDVSEQIKARLGFQDKDLFVIQHEASELYATTRQAFAKN
jgi:putative nucleotidyltransferase with HDIG domain